jgi:hypothetical protein
MELRNDETVATAGDSEPLVAAAGGERRVE